MDCSTPGFPVHHQFLELTQTHVHLISDAIQPSHPLSSPFLLPSIFLSIRVFSSESALRIRWLEKGMANHLVVLPWEPWTVWKGKKIWHWKMNSDTGQIERLMQATYWTRLRLQNEVQHWPLWLSSTDHSNTSKDRTLTLAKVRNCTLNYFGQICIPNPAHISSWHLATNYTLILSIDEMLTLVWDKTRAHQS